MRVHLWSSFLPSQMLRDVGILTTSLKRSGTGERENDSGPAASSGGLKQSFPCPSSRQSTGRFVSSTRANLFVCQSREEGSRVGVLRAEASSSRRLSTTPSAPRESQEKETRRWNIKRETEKDTFERERERQRERRAVGQSRRGVPRRRRGTARGKEKGEGVQRRLVVEVQIRLCAVSLRGSQLRSQKSYYSPVSFSDAGPSSPAVVPSSSRCHQSARNATLSFEGAADPAGKKNILIFT